MRLTALESAALREICRQEANWREILERQVATATVLGRKNSGAGFFTSFSIDRTTLPVTDGRRVIGNVAAALEGFQDPLLLMLFMNDGYADFLEGAAVRDSTLGIDLATIAFKVIRQ
jgi:hypothetical protein